MQRVEDANGVISFQVPGDWRVEREGERVAVASPDQKSNVVVVSGAKEAAAVGEWAVVGEGAVVKQRQQIPDGHIAVGVPAKVLDRQVTPEYKKQWTIFKDTYVDLARRYPKGLKRIG